MLSRFEKVFETIRKNNRNCKEILKKYNLKKSRRKASTNEHVGLIFIFDSKRSRSKTICNNSKKDRYNKRNLHRNRLQRRHSKRKINKKWFPISKEKKFRFNRMMKLGISSLLHNKITITI
jgi:hypothetical protein